VFGNLLAQNFNISIAKDAQQHAPILCEPIEEIST